MYGSGSALSFLSAGGSTMEADFDFTLGLEQEAMVQMLLALGGQWAGAMADAGAKEYHAAVGLVPETVQDWKQPKVPEESKEQGQAGTETAAEGEVQPSKWSQLLKQRREKAALLASVLKQALENPAAAITAITASQAEAPELPQYLCAIAAVALSLGRAGAAGTKPAGAAGDLPGAAAGSESAGLLVNERLVEAAGALAGRVKEEYVRDVLAMNELKWIPPVTGVEEEEAVPGAARQGPSAEEEGEEKEGEQGEEKAGDEEGQGSAAPLIAKSRPSWEVFETGDKLFIPQAAREQLLWLAEVGNLRSRLLSQRLRALASALASTDPAFQGLGPFHDIRAELPLLPEFDVSAWDEEDERVLQEEAKVQAKFDGKAIPNNQDIAAVAMAAIAAAAEATVNARGCMAWGLCRYV